jgi:hypothetical protein
MEEWDQLQTPRNRSIFSISPAPQTARRCWTSVRLISQTSPASPAIEIEPSLLHPSPYSSYCNLEDRRGRNHVREESQLSFEPLLSGQRCDQRQLENSWVKVMHDHHEPPPGSDSMA